MTKNKKIILSITLIIFSFSLFKIVSAVEFVPQVTIPNSEFTAEQAVQLEYGLRPIGNYIKAIYNYALIIVGILAAIVLIIGGIIWLTSAGNSEKISQAKSWITGALTGLILMFLSYTILKTINPQLVSLRVPGIQTIGNINKGCCRLQKNELRNPFLVPGENIIKLTFNATSVECYNRALAVKEPGIKNPDDLTKEEKADIEKYMKDQLKFYPSEAAAGFNTCQPKGAYIEYLSHSVNTSNNYSEADLSHIYCRNSIRQRTFNTNENHFSFFMPYADCSTLSIDEIKRVAKNQYPNYTTIQNENEFITLTCTGRSNGSTCTTLTGKLAGSTFTWTSCYDNICWYNEDIRGGLGEPCGVDDSFCVPSGTDCEDIPGFIDRSWEWGGGDCGPDLKCCKKDKTYWRKLGY
ncbi:MAG: pilin [Patescibacteria group bacterium]|jgi:hypothetical protein